MKLERWDIKWCVNYRPRFRRRIGIYFGIWAGSWEKWRDLGCRGTKGCSPGRGFLSTDTRDWLCARGRMPFSRHVRDVCLRRTGMKSSDKLRWDEWEEFRQDRSHPQYRGHLLLPCTPRKKRKEKEKANSPARKCRGRRWKRRSRRRENRRNCNKMAAINNTAKNCIKFALDAFLLKS